MKYSFLRFFLIFLCFINVSCAQTYMSEAENTVDLVIGELEQMLTKKYHLEAIGVSVSMPRGIVKKLGIDFNIEGKSSKVLARCAITF